MILPTLSTTATALMWRSCISAIASMALTSGVTATTWREVLGVKLGVKFGGVVELRERWKQSWEPCGGLSSIPDGLHPRAHLLGAPPQLLDRLLGQGPKVVAVDGQEPGKGVKGWINEPATQQPTSSTLPIKSQPVNSNKQTNPDPPPPDDVGLADDVDDGLGVVVQRQAVDDGDGARARLGAGFGEEGVGWFAVGVCPSFTA